MIWITPYIYKNKYNKLCYSINREWGHFLELFKENWFIITPEFNFKHFNFKKIKLVIISGGGNLSNFEKKKQNIIRDKFEKKIILECVKNKIPILAVCRGFQLIAQIYKGKIINDKKHLKDHKIDLKINKKIFPKFIKVNSNHQYVVTKLDSFKVIGKAKDNSIEIAFNKKDKIFCTMFHPERFSKKKKYYF